MAGTCISHAIDLILAQTLTRVHCTSVHAPGTLPFGMETRSPRPGPSPSLDPSAEPHPNPNSGPQSTLTLTLNSPLTRLIALLLDGLGCPISASASVPCPLVSLILPGLLSCLLRPGGYAEHYSQRVRHLTLTIALTFPLALTLTLTLAQSADFSTLALTLTLSTVSPLHPYLPP